MPFAMLRWFTPRHFEVKMWIPIDGILIAINVGLGLLLYIRSRRVRSVAPTQHTTHAHDTTHDTTLAAVLASLCLIPYSARQIRSELAKIVKKENKVCYHRTGVHLRFEPGGMAYVGPPYPELAAARLATSYPQLSTHWRAAYRTRPSIVIEHTASTASGTHLTLTVTTATPASPCSLRVFLFCL